MHLNPSRSLIALLMVLAATGTNLPAAQPIDRVSPEISESTRVTLRGNVHPAVAQAAGATPVVPVSMERMILVLQSDPAQQTALEQLIAQQHDPKSPQFHKFLTPQQFGSQFGVSNNDIQTISTWLTSHGFHIDEIPAGHRSIVFSGSSDQVSSAFQTEIKQYTVGKERHYANASDPQIPLGLAQAVKGVLKLHDFRYASAINNKQVIAPATAAPQFTYGSSHYMGPPDFATIYDVAPLYAGGIDGTGESIAIVARSNIDLNDVQSFRSYFSLPYNQPRVTIVNSDPGLNGDEAEAILDTEWSGAVAPKATVNLVVAASTNTADGVDLSAQYIVNHNVAPVMSVSYGACEYYMGSGELGFYNSLWEQAAAQGISVFVSSGDSGASGCDGGGSSSGSGRGVNGLCSSPYSTCVGGTQFNDAANPGQYWLPGNNSSMGSAQGYIPEAVWNESGNDSGSGLWAGGGGASIAFSKPSWQSGPGVPADGVRDVPDVSLDAAIHDGYLIVGGGNLMYIGGTSAASPSFAGLMALVDQKTGGRQGNANTNLYPLATKQATGGAPIFHDITSGNNSVPGVAGFSALTGYDLATGLGSVDANLLVNHWTDTTITTPGLSLLAAQNNLLLTQGQTTTVVLTALPLGTFNSAVALTTTGVPTGLTVSLSTANFNAPGSGKTILTVTTSKTLAYGSYTFNVTATGGGVTAVAPITVTMQSPGTFAFTTSTNFFISGQGNTRSMNVYLTPSGGFASTVAITVPGLPNGITVTAPSTPLSGTTKATVPLTFTATQNAATGVYQLLATATGGGITKTFPLQLTVTGPSDCTLASNPSSVSINAGDSAGIEVYCGNVKGNFSDVLQLAVSSNKPDGVSIQQLRMQAVPGNPAGHTTLAITSANTAVPGNYNITVNATTPLGFSQTINIPFVITAPSALLMTSSAPSVTVYTGQTAQVKVTLKHSGNFNSAVQLVAAGFPSGVQATLSQTAVAAPGDAIITITIAASQYAAPGTRYYFVVAAETASQTFGVPIGLVVAPGPNFALTATPSTTSVAQGNTITAGTVIIGSFVNGFNSAVTLTASGMPTGLTATLAKPVLTGSGATSSLALAASANTPTGHYPIYVTATSGALTQMVAFQITVVQPPNFNFKAAAATSTLLQGGTINAGTLSIDTLVNGFNSAVTLGASGLPTGMSASFAKTSLSGAGASTTLSLTAAKTVAAGSYAITVTATGGGLIKTASLTINVVPAPSFTLKATTSSNAVVQGNALTVGTLTITPANGFNSAVTLTATGMPAGVTAAFSTTSLAAGASSILNVTTAKTVTPGSYAIAVTAAGGGLTQTTTLPLTVTGAPSFTLKNTAPATSSLIQGNTLNAGTLSIGSFVNGFNSTVALSASGMPSGMTVTFGATSLAGLGASTPLSIAATSAVPPGAYKITLIAVGGGVTQSATISVTVAAPPNFSLKAVSVTTTAQPNTTVTAGTLSIGSFVNGFNAAVSLSASGLPKGMTASFTKTSLSGSGSSTMMTLNASSTVASGTYAITITGTGGGVTQTALLTINVAAAPSVKK